MTNETINELCDRLGVTANNLVSELCRYCTTMDKIGIIAWSIMVVITTIICIKLKDKYMEWLDDDNFCYFLIVIPIFIYAFAAIVIPIMGVDLLKWNISPVSAAINFIRSK